MSNFISFEEVFETVPTEEILKDTKKTSADLFYTPDPRKFNGVYAGSIRFLANPYDKVKPWYEKLTAYNMVDPDTGQKRIVECPANDKNCIVHQTWLKLSKSPLPSDNDKESGKVRVVSRSKNFISYIQILDDKQRPDDIGKIKLWQYGTKIHSKILDAMNPNLDLNKFARKKEVFDWWTGNIFSVYVTIQNNNNNYDSCKFEDAPQPIMLGNRPAEKTKEDFDKIVELFKASPDIQPYANFKGWDDETRDFVNRVIASLNPTGKVISTAMPSNVMQNVGKPSQAAQTSSVSSFDSFDEALDIKNLSSSTGTSAKADMFDDEELKALLV